MRTTKFWSSTSITSSRYAKRCPRRESVESTCAHGTKRRHRTVVRSRIPTSQRRSKRSCGRSMQHSIPCASSRNLRSSRRNYSLFKNSTETGNSNLLTVPLLNELQREVDFLRRDGTLWRLWLGCEVAIQREERNKEGDPDWPKKRETTQDRKQHEERVKIHPRPHELRPQYIVDKTHGNDAPNSKAYGRPHRPDNHEVDDGRHQNERRAPGRYERYKRRDKSEHHRIGHTKERETNAT